MTHEQNRAAAAKRHAWAVGSVSGQNYDNTTKDFIAGCRWEEQALAEFSLDDADPDDRKYASTVAVIQAALAGWLGVSVDTPMGELLTKLRKLRGQPWPPQGFGNPDALADFYNSIYKEKMHGSAHPTDAHQDTCDLIYKQGWHAGLNAGISKQGLSKAIKHDGPFPEGYEIWVESENPTPFVENTRSRAQKIDATWSGPWRTPGQGGLIVADAWIHATGAVSVPIVDEAGGA